MDIMELANILSQMYDNALEGEKVAMIHLFGIRYSSIIRNNNFVASDIISSTRLADGSQIRESYYAEINKGVNLAKYVIEKCKIRDLLKEIME
jgi:5-methylcytosine-specific restriction protein B